MADIFDADQGWKPEVTVAGWTHQTQRAQLGRHTTYSASKLIVALDGACRDNGKASAKAAVGIFFGKGNSHNRAEMLVDDPDITWTSQRAELWAASRALRLVTGMTISKCRHCHPPMQLSLDRVIFKSDSAYVVRGITDFYLKWQQHDWKNALGNPIANKDLWDRLYKQVTRLQRFGMGVSFWQVRRERNSQADQLANKALTQQLPAMFPYPKTRKRKREEEGAVALGRVLVDTSRTSDPVWRHHHELAHVDLSIFKTTLRFYGQITDITEADVQAKIDSNERCLSCYERGARDHAADDDDQREEPAAKRTRIEPATEVSLFQIRDESMVETPSPGGLAFAENFQFKFEQPSGVVF